MNNEGSHAFGRRGAAANGNGPFGGMHSGGQRGLREAVDFDGSGGEQRRDQRNDRQRNVVPFGGFGRSNEDIARLSRMSGPRLHCARCGRNGHVATGCYRNANGSIRNIHHKNDMRCYSCNLSGHLARECPSLRNCYSRRSSISEMTVIEGGSCTSDEAALMSPSSVTLEEPIEVVENNRPAQGIHMICALLKDDEVRWEIARSNPELYADLINYVLAHIRSGFQ